MYIEFQIKDSDMNNIRIKDTISSVKKWYKHFLTSILKSNPIN